MPWFKVDDKLHDHTKAALAGVDAMGLWVLAGSWCAEHLDTEGFVPERVLARFVTRWRRVADKLVTVSLWERDEMGTEKGFRFLHWAEFQLTPADQDKDRSAARDRMRKLRAERKACSPEQGANVRRTFADVLDPTPKPKPLPTVPSELSEQRVEKVAHESNARDDEPRGPIVDVGMLQLARTYTNVVKLSNPGKVAHVCMAAQFAGYTQDQIRDGLTVLAEERRSVTVETLRIAIEGPPVASRPTVRASTTDARVTDALARAAAYDEDTPPQIGATS